MIRLLFAAALILPVAAHAETFDEMWSRRIAYPMGWGPEPVKVKTIDVKPTPEVKKPEEPRHRHRHRL